MTKKSHAVGDRQFIGLERIKPSPYQPRTYFDADKLAELAASMKSSTQLTDCLVRVSPGYRGAGTPESFELIGGERRWRAAKTAGIRGVWCRVIEADNQLAQRLATFDNLDRENLTEVEKLWAFRKLIDRGACTQKELAAELKLTPAALSNRLRILTVPAEWLDRISQETYGLSTTHLRSLVPWIKRENVLAMVWADLQAEASKHGSDWKCTVAEFAGIVLYAVKKLSRPLKDGEHIVRLPGVKVHGDVDVALTPAQRCDNELDCVSVKLDPDGGKEKRAFNVELWETFQLESEQAQRAESKPSPAKKSEVAEERRDEFQRKLYRWKLTQLQRMIVERFESVSGPIDQQNVPFPEIVQLHLLWFACHGDSRQTNARSEDLADPVSEAGGRAIRHGGQIFNPVSVFETLDTIAAGREHRNKVFRAVGLCLANWWSADFEGPRRGVTPAAIEWAAGQFGFDVCSPWRLTRDFLSLYSVAGLKTLADEWAHAFDAKTAGKESMINELLDWCDEKPAPQSLAKLKAMEL
tara:strand:+ start:290717 stop:292291 length:1575 start_codon:yes stop_codon:yes gene_type:complete